MKNTDEVNKARKLRESVCCYKRERFNEPALDTDTQGRCVYLCVFVITYLPLVFI